MALWASRKYIVGVAVLATVLARVSVAFAQSAPPATAQQVADAVALHPTIPSGPVSFLPNDASATWNSLQANYSVPQWFQDAKFGIMMHWGIYSAPAKHNEWDEKYMYGANSGISSWYTSNFGPRNNFGYLDFLNPNKTALAGSPASAYYTPFTAANWDPTAWSTLFKNAGAKYVTMTAEHHDGFALWNSQVAPFNTVNFGPLRDLVGDLAAAVRTQGMKFGVQDHGIENYTFLSQIGGSTTTPNDYNLTITTAGGQVLNRKDYYRPDLRTFTGSVPDPLTNFLDNWYQRNVELINQYQPDLLWFDNGINPRVLDPLKQKVAAYYYNRAATWGKQVTITAKRDTDSVTGAVSEAYLAGDVHDFEKTGRAPTTIQAVPFQVHDTLTNGTTWAYNEIDQPGVNGDAGRYVRIISTATSVNGTFLLNIAPMADGTIPQAQQTILTGIGNWLATNGDAIYGTRPWTKSGEGNLSYTSSSWKATDIRFTTKGNDLYAILMAWPGTTATIQSLGTTDLLPGSSIQSIELLGYAGGPLSFVQDATKLTINLPAQPAGSNYAFAFKIKGTALVPEPTGFFLFGAGALFIMCSKVRRSNQPLVDSPPI